MFGGGLISLKMPHLNFCSAHFHRAFRISTWFIQRERRTKLTMLTILIKSSRICSKPDRVELSWTFNTCRSCFTGATRGTPCATTAPAVLPPKPMSGKFLLSYWVVCAQRPVCPVPWMLLICRNCCLNINPWELSLDQHGSTLFSLEHLSGVFLQPDLISFNSAIAAAATSHSSSWSAASTLLKRAQQATCPLCDWNELWAWPCWPSPHAKCHPRWAVVWVTWVSVVGWVAALNGIKPLQSRLAALAWKREFWN